MSQYRVTMHFRSHLSTRQKCSPGLLKGPYLSSFIMGDLCTAERFLQAIQVINLATNNYGINESVVESNVMENRPMEDLVSIKNYRLENQIMRIKVGENALMSSLLRIFNMPSNGLEVTKERIMNYSHS